MELSARTKIDDLLNAYPFIMDFLLMQSPKFKLLQSTVMRKTVGKVATLTQAASIGDIPLEKLMLDIAAEIEAKTGDKVLIQRESPGPELAYDAEARQNILKTIIRDLHKGEDMAVLKRRFHDLIKDIGASEIAKMEQKLIEEGMPESEIKRLCDVHVEVFKESLEKKEAPLVPPGHPVHTFMLENKEAVKLTGAINAIVNKFCDSGDLELFKQSSRELEKTLERLSEINLHYLRKENQLFPVLEAHDISGPTEVMWVIHDDIRSMLKKAKSHVAALQVSDAITTLSQLLQAINDMAYKEEHILFPMSLEVLSDLEWMKVRAGEDEIGYAWTKPETDWISGDAKIPHVEKSAVESARMELSTGHLSPGQVNLVLTHLPVEISFVNERDEVEYYSQVKEKIFPRSPGVIGRKVQNCHPPRSLHMVQKILDEFKAGTKDVADFWIQIKDKFIYIRYYAVRDADGTYKGTLEVVQDVTDIRNLSGEKRLLDWA
jgi:DUF438 domain-containing protein